MTAEREAAVVAAAKVWRFCRRNPISGDTYHRACRAMDEAVAALIGELVGEPTPPPTPAEIEHGLEIVRLATAYAEAQRAEWDRNEAAS